MVAQTGTSGTKGIVYRYYACVRQKKHQCEKKPVSKTKLEDFIVYKTMEFLQDDIVIERLSAKLYELQYTESTILPKLQEQLKQKEKEIENIVNAVQKGYATETLLKRLDGLEKQKREISDVIAKEQLKSPIFSQDHFKMALSNFRKIDITTQEGKRKIIDTFINAIYLYDDHLKIIYNANGKEETISLAELESSTLFSRGAPCFVDKNAVHGKNLGKNIVFRGFLLFFRQKRDFYVPSKQVSILCCLLTVFNTVREQYEHAFCGIFLAPCRSSSLQYLGIAASSSRQLIQKSCRKKCKAIKSS